MHRDRRDQSRCTVETTQSLLARHAEILVIVKGLDETFAQTIHARTSYQPHAIAWGRSFVDIFSRDADGVPVIDLRALPRYRPTGRRFRLPAGCPRRDKTLPARRLPLR